MKTARTTITATLSAMLLLTALTFSCKKPHAPGTEAADSTSVEEVHHVYKYGICTDSLCENFYEVKNGDSPSAILGRLGFTAARAESINKAWSRLLDPKKLRAGMTYSILTATDTTAAVRYIAFAKSAAEYLIIDLTADTVRAYEYNKEVRLERRYLEGTITSSLWNIIKANGADPLLALKISDIYSWQIDFFDVKEGDSFRIIYDVAFIDDTTELNISSIEGAVFVHKGKEYVAIPFSQDGFREYFDDAGNSLRGEFLKAPLDFFRISSRFSNARFHPVLKYYRPHHGVDYAAPTGTPIKTIGNGTVIAKGYDKKGGGNYVKVKHNSVYTTTYMHMSRFAKGIAQGASVSQGQVIGYVGATGLATGPHLDFRVFKNGKPINPLSMESPPAKPVRKDLRDSFNIVKQSVHAELDSLQSLFLKSRHITAVQDSLADSIRKQKKTH